MFIMSSSLTFVIVYWKLFPIWMKISLLKGLTSLKYWHFPGIFVYWIMMKAFELRSFWCSSLFIDILVIGCARTVWAVINVEWQQSSNAPVESNNHVKAQWTQPNGKWREKWIHFTKNGLFIQRFIWIQLISHFVYNKKINFFLFFQFSIFLHFI